LFADCGLNELIDKELSEYVPH